MQENYVLCSKSVSVNEQNPPTSLNKVVRILLPSDLRFVFGFGGRLKAPRFQEGLAFGTFDTMGLGRRTPVERLGWRPLTACLSMDCYLLANVLTLG